MKLVITDFNMPVMDGLRFVKALKALPEYRFCPVIMLTTEGDSTMKQQGKEAGIKAWVIKPFKP